ncbi:MAG: Mrp/NBP35 family ATP-binding protein [Oligoflexales bacterium]
MNPDKSQIISSLAEGVAHGDIPSDAAERFLEIEAASEDSFRLHLKSNDLTLSQKIEIEQYIHREFPNYAVNFKRQGASGAPTPKFEKVVRRTAAAIEGVRSVLVVASGKGGVGKSTVSANIAVGLADLGLRVGLLDADLYGPSIPTMLDVYEYPQVSDRKLKPVEAYGVSCMSSGFMSDERNPMIWRGPMLSKAFEQFIRDVHWGDLDILVMDLPPGTGDIQMTLLEKVVVNHAVVVTTPQDIALQDAHRAVSMFEKAGTPILGVVENMAYHECSACGHQDRIFGGGGGLSMSTERGLDFLGQIPLDSLVRRCGDQGQPIVLDKDSSSGEAFRDLCRKIQNKNSVNSDEGA